jgi:hypothetical protein
MQRVRKRFAVAVSLIGALFLCTPGYAQAPKAPGATRTVNLTLEQRHVIRELVRELQVKQAAADSKVAAGDPVPGKTELHAMPPLIGQKVPQIRSHRLYVTRQQIVIVDPKEQRVVEVVE